MEMKNLKDNESTIIGVSNHIKEIREKIKLAAKSDLTVLILGPTGTGKELIAKSIHNQSKREGKFIPVNCAAIPNDLFVSELFGYKKGTHSTAHTDHKGYIEQAKPEPPDHLWL